MRPFLADVFTDDFTHDKNPFLPACETLMAVVCFLVVFVIYQFITADLQTFIYFQF